MITPRMNMDEPEQKLPKATMPSAMLTKYEDRTFVYEVDDKWQWEELIGDIDAFLEQATNENDYFQRIEAVLEWINTDLTGGYDSGYEAKETVLKELLKRRFKSEK